VGVLYGAGHVYALTAPVGWELDNQAGASRGIHAVFYPKGGSWADSATVMYANTGPPLRPDESIDSYIADALREFRANVGPGLREQAAEPLKTRDGKLAHVRLLSGDQWNNLETVVYIPERHATVILVLTSKSEPSYEASQDAFTQLVQSYEFLGKSFREVSDPQHLIRIADAATRTAQGKSYDRAVGEHFASQHARTMKSCLDSLTAPDLSPFDILVFVGETARADRVVVQPETDTALCVRSRIVGTPFPSPPNTGSWVHIAMKITR
jgi:hypothetical protein